MTLLLLPGLVCDRAVWAPVMAKLGARVDCVVPEYPGETSLGAMAQRVIDPAPERFALAGHSMGARVAVEVLRRVPGRVERIALLDTGYRPLPTGEAGEAERAGRMALLSTARSEGMRAMGRQWSARMVHPERLADEPLMGAILDMIGRRTPEEFAAQIEALLARPDVTDMVSGIRCPALVLCGADDSWAPLAQHRELAALIPGSRLAVIERCGHMAPMERPEAVAAELTRWLAEPA